MDYERHLLGHERRLKKFAVLARRVCRRWFWLIDDPYNTHFWHSTVILEFNISSTGRKSIRRLVRFHKRLSNSKGCDLLILFQFNGGSRLLEGWILENPSSDESLKLRLFIHGMHLIIPYVPQIIRLDFNSDQLQILKHFLSILNGFRPAKRLSLLSINHAPGPTVTINPQEALRATAVPGFTSIGRPRTELSRSVVHLPHANSFTFPDFSWVGGLLFPQGISHLNISRHEPSRSTTLTLTKAFNTHPSICNTLTSMKVKVRHWSGSNSGSNRHNNLGPITLESIITLGNLQSLVIDEYSVYDCKLFKIFRYFNMPRLERAEFMFRCPEAVPINVQQEITTGSYQLSLPSLQTVAIHATRPTFFSSVLQLIGTIAKVPLKRLELNVEGVDEYYKSEEGEVEALEQLGSTLSFFKIEELKLSCQEVNTVRFMLMTLRHLDTSLLRCLHIGYPRHDEHPRLEDLSSFFVGPKSTPLLEEAEFLDLNLYNFLLELSCLETGALRSISVKLSNPESVEQLVTENNLLTSLQGSWNIQANSIRHMRFKFNQSYISCIHHIWSLTPNAEYVEVTIYLSSVSDCIDREAEINVFYDLLKPSPDSDLLFPLLKSFKGTFQFPSSITDLEEVRTEIMMMCRARSEAGVPHLDLRYLCEAYEYEGLDRVFQFCLEVPSPTSVRH
jgi:hypothetical protein